MIFFLDVKLEKVKVFGVDYVINYCINFNWDEIVMKIIDGEGVDIIFECGGV